MIEEEEWAENPLFTLPGWALAAVDLWIDCRRFGNGMGGMALPCAGGVGEQLAALMDAFTMLTAWTEKSRDE